MTTNKCMALFLSPGQTSKILLMQAEIGQLEHQQEQFGVNNSDMINRLKYKMTSVLLAADVFFGGKGLKDQFISQKISEFELSWLNSDTSKTHDCDVTSDDDIEQQMDSTESKERCDTELPWATSDPSDASTLDLSDGVGTNLSNGSEQKELQDKTDKTKDLQFSKLESLKTLNASLKKQLKDLKKLSMSVMQLAANQTSITEELRASKNEIARLQEQQDKSSIETNRMDEKYVSRTEYREVQKDLQLKTTQCVQYEDELKMMWEDNRNLLEKEASYLEQKNKELSEKLTKKDNQIKIMTKEIENQRSEMKKFAEVKTQPVIKIDEKDKKYIVVTGTEDCNGFFPMDSVQVVRYSDTNNLDHLPRHLTSYHREMFVTCDSLAFEKGMYYKNLISHCRNRRKLQPDGEIHVIGSPSCPEINDLPLEFRLIISSYVYYTSMCTLTNAMTRHWQKYADKLLSSKKKNDFSF